VFPHAFLGSGWLGPARAEGPTGAFFLIVTKRPDDAVECITATLSELMVTVGANIDGYQSAMTEVVGTLDSFGEAALNQSWKIRRPYRG